MIESYNLYISDSIGVQSTQGATMDVSVESIVNAVQNTHDIFDKFTDFEVDVFAILGMRNLSAFIGEVFAQTLVRHTNDIFVRNPHQDGYPDLLLMDEQGIKDWERLKDFKKDKAPFSPFPNGSIEIKATCGSVPTPAICRKRGIEKPDIGDQRIQVLMGYDWKAHHRETNNLMGIWWDFIRRVPRITGLFFSNNLTQDDWGRIVQPKDGGGRTTSVSIMNRAGIKKMYDGTILVHSDERYAAFLNRYNSSDKL